VLGVLLFPLALYYRLWQRGCLKLEPALQWLDFSAKGYMMLKPIENPCKYMADLTRCGLMVMLRTVPAFLELYLRTGLFLCHMACVHLVT